MIVSRRLVVLILVYIALDLSLPAMPGAFVFDATQSVESVQRSRSQDVAAAVSGPVVARDRRDSVTVDDTALVKPFAETRRLAPMATRPRPVRQTTTPDFPPPSEDSH